MKTPMLLLVDDSMTTEQEVRSALAGEPIEIAVTANGYSALDLIEAQRPNVVLASTTTPGVNGYGLAQYVSRRSYLSNVAVLLLTGDITPADTQRMKAAGARGFVSRPIEPAVLRANVKEVLIFPGPELREVDMIGQLTPAFDAIDDSMTSNLPGGKAPTGENPITPEVLARIVSDAVTHALAAYERARSQAPAPARDAASGSGRREAAAPQSPGRMEQQRLQREMGIDNIEFEPAPPAPPGADTALSAQMGVDEFSFDDARDVQAASPSSRPRTSRRTENPAAGAASALEPLRDAVASLGTTVAEGAGRLRSALAGRAKPRPGDPPPEPRDD